MTPGLSSLFWFVAVVALIPLVLWLVKRTPMGRASGTGAMRSISVLPLSASQRVAIVEVGNGAARRWLVLGVSTQSITTLHTMEPHADPTPGAVEPGAAFSQLLSRLKRSD